MKRALKWFGMITGGLAGLLVAALAVVHLLDRHERQPREAQNPDLDVGDIVVQRTEKPPDGKAWAVVLARVTSRRSGALLRWHLYRHRSDESYDPHKPNAVVYGVNEPRIRWRTPTHVQLCTEADPRNLLIKYEGTARYSSRPDATDRVTYEYLDERGRFYYWITVNEKCQPDPH